MIEALINYIHLAYPGALRLCKRFDGAARSVMKGLSPVDWLTSAALSELEAYSQGSERTTHPVTGEWPSIKISDDPIEIRIE